MKNRKDNKGVVLNRNEYQRKDGRYEYIEMINGKKIQITKPTLKQLREAVSEIKAKQYFGKDTMNNTMTVNQLFEMWKAQKIGLKDNVFQNYIYSYEAFVKNYLGNKKIKSIKKHDIKMYYKRLLDERGMKIRSCEVIQNILYQMFQLAIDNDILITNPCDKVLAEFKRAKEYGSNKREALTIEQQKAFENYLERPENKPWQPILLFMLYSGTRVGECTGLRWDDISDSEISINHTLVYYDNRELKLKNKMTYSINTPKTEAGNRVIPLISQSRHALELQKNYLKETELECKCVVDGFTNFIFINRFGEPLNQGTINKAIRRIVRDYNLEEIEIAEKENRQAILLPHISSHILRHTFATRMIEANTNIKVIQDILGHKDIQTTMDIYVDAQSEFKKKEIDKLSLVLSNL